LSVIKSLLFGKNIDPACEYCEWGRPSQDEKMILCRHNGVVAPYFSCRRFKYAPLKRKPKPVPVLPDYNPEDFKL